MTLIGMPRMDEHELDLGRHPGPVNSVDDRVHPVSPYNRGRYGASATVNRLVVTTLFASDLSNVHHWLRLSQSYLIHHPFSILW